MENTKSGLGLLVWTLAAGALGALAYGYLLAEWRLPWLFLGDILGTAALTHLVIDYRRHGPAAIALFGVVCGILLMWIAAGAAVLLDSPSSTDWLPIDLSPLGFVAGILGGGVAWLAGQAEGAIRP